MNSCILMAQIISAPQLRKTQDELELTEMMVQFQSSNPKDPPSNLKVIGWRQTAKTIHENYFEGDRVILQGRLSMNVFENSQGVKEKRAELVVSRIDKLDGTGGNTPFSSSVSSSNSDNVVSMNSYKPAPNPEYQQEEVEVGSSSPAMEVATNSSDSGSLDDIPF